MDHIRIRRRENRHIAFLSLLTGMLIASSAIANPRFHVFNMSEGPVKVRIYNGNDSSCDAWAKSHSVGSWEQGNFGCEGNGKGQCKVRIENKNGKKRCDYKDQYDLYNTCGTHAIKVPDGNTLTVLNNSHECMLEE